MVKTIIISILGLALLSVILFTCGVISLGANQAVRATHLQDATENYEQFQDIYNTCSKLNTDLCNMKDMPNDDKSFEQFSKAQRINAIKTNLNRWVEDYNAKSKMWGRALWKSKSLPYQLDVNQFNCYSQK